MPSCHVAAIQLNNGGDVHNNIAALTDYIRAAHAKGARMILTPECSDDMAWPAKEKLRLAYDEASHPMLIQMQDLAAQLQIELILGSIDLRSDHADKLYNRSYAIGSDGKVIAHYDKIHLFDVTLKNGEAYQESAYYHSGDQLSLANLTSAHVGLSICYDVRFAHLYRALAKQGAQILCVPAAFSVPTGRSHWEVLLRARAIETGSYVIAAGQTGTHPGDRETYGHSMIINPWGEIICKMDGKNQTGFIDAVIDLDEVDICRRAIPSLKHDKDFN